MTQEERLKALLATAHKAKEQLEEALVKQTDLMAEAHARAAMLKIAWDAAEDDDD